MLGDGATNACAGMGVRKIAVGGCASRAWVRGGMPMRRADKMPARGRRGLTKRPIRRASMGGTPGLGKAGGAGPQQGWAAAERAPPQWRDSRQSAPIFRRPDLTRRDCVRCASGPSALRRRIRDARCGWGRRFPRHGTEPRLHAGDNGGTLSRSAVVGRARASVRGILS